MMDSLPDQFNALVIGGSGTIGAAFVDLLRKSPRCASVHGLHRHLPPRVDFANADSVARAARELAAGPRYHLVINAAGLLHTETFMPEKRLADLNYAQMQATFQADTFGPRWCCATSCHCSTATVPSWPCCRRKWAASATTGSAAGTSYRASKAALNMLIRTAAIEVARSQPNSVLMALHPVTVSSRLSRPFRGEAIGRPAPDAAAHMLGVLDKLTRADSGSFRSYNGAELPW